MPSERHLPPGLPEVLYHHGRPDGIGGFGSGTGSKCLGDEPRLPIIWLHLQECTCCTESFIRAAHPIVATLLLDKISLDYTETLMAAAGEQAEAAKEETMEKYYGNYLLMIEGSLPTKTRLIVA